MSFTSNPLRGSDAAGDFTGGGDGGEIVTWRAEPGIALGEEDAHDRGFPKNNNGPSASDRTVRIGGAGRGVGALIGSRGGRGRSTKEVRGSPTVKFRPDSEIAANPKWQGNATVLPEEEETQSAGTASTTKRAFVADVGVRKSAWIESGPGSAERPWSRYLQRTQTRNRDAASQPPSACSSSYVRLLLHAVNISLAAGISTFLCVRSYFCNAVRMCVCARAYVCVSVRLRCRCVATLAAHRRGVLPAFGW